MDATRTRVARVYRSLPLWLARDYLCELGGRARDAQTIQGERWRAELSDAPDIVLGAMRIGQIEIVFDGDAEILQSLVAAFEKRRWARADELRALE
jgi:hypothetical protein